MQTSAMPAAHGSPAPTQLQLAAFRAQLYEQLHFRTEQLRRLRESAPRRTDRTQEVGEFLVAAARSALADVRAALQRMADGTYGWCTECGERLPLERLEVVPQVALCLVCQRSVELG
jgi:DnaK suppressor protein